LFVLRAPHRCGCGQQPVFHGESVWQAEGRKIVLQVLLEAFPDLPTWICFAKCSDEIQKNGLNNLTV
jgi:hypothetical protein